MTEPTSPPSSSPPGVSVGPIGLKIPTATGGAPQGTPPSNSAGESTPHPPSPTKPILTPPAMMDAPSPSWWRRLLPSKFRQDSGDGNGSGTHGASKPSNNGQWERQMMEKLLFAALSEQRSSRRWGIFFKLLSFSYITLGIFVTASLFQDSKDSTSPTHGQHTALVEIRGAIASGSEAGAERLLPALGKAFKSSEAKGVIVRINSPGGSPVQSGIVYDEIIRLRAKYPSKPLYVVIEDLCASGGYYIAASADKIFVDKASLVGSIGVIMNGFGFTGTMEKLGVERRAYHAGENKAFLDPFSPASEQQVAFAQKLLGEIHQQFITVVKKGRGTRLKDDPDTFSGLIWTGAKSIEMGLTDGYGTVDSVARDIIKAEKIINYSERDNPLDRLGRQLGVSVGATIAESLGWAPRLSVR